jgi:hypothetical protein
MRSSSSRLVAAVVLALSLLGLALPATASAAPAGSTSTSATSTSANSARPAAGWIYWSTYSSAASCIATGSILAYAGSPIYAAYYCEEEYSTVGNVFSYELFLYKRF